MKVSKRATRRAVSFLGSPSVMVAALRMDSCAPIATWSARMLADLPSAPADGPAQSSRVRLPACGPLEPFHVGPCNSMGDADGPNNGLCACLASSAPGALHVWQALLAALHGHVAHAAAELSTHRYGPVTLSYIPGNP